MQTSQPPDSSPDGCKGTGVQVSRTTIPCGDDPTTLRFECLSDAGSSYGALVDNVSVTAVPESSTLLLLGTGALLLESRRRRRRNT
jgi:hypothetical protein